MNTTGKTVVITTEELRTNGFEIRVEQTEVMYRLFPASPADALSLMTNSSKELQAFSN
ncbi:hypothetical protein [Segetibacter sp. 3557_3]|uniref:hypothetical protein n=1 Tax=Segetibacter sp. 3557_3 TaxID=2547429 RepID=UPI0014048083|nr:hypothetical protein [Segetibacter sp. 3557_3]